MDITMKQLECNTCGGVYSSKNDDGTAYYHACPLILDKSGECVERPDKRDENVGKKQEGKGAEIVT